MSSPTPTPSVPKLNPAWIQHAKAEFDAFLAETHFLTISRNGTRGSTFTYPEALILFIAVFSVKVHVKTYQGIHRLVVKYWAFLTPDPTLPPPSESQLRGRLKKIRHTPRTPARFVSLFVPTNGVE